MESQFVGVYSLFYSILSGIERDLYKRNDLELANNKLPAHNGSFFNLGSSKFSTQKTGYFLS